MNIDQIIDEWKQVQEEYDRQRQEMTAKVTDLLKATLQKFLKETPEIKMVTWLQYTPYFNDGDPCVFQVHGFEFVGEQQLSHDEDDNGYCDGISTYRYHPEDGISRETWERCKKLDTALTQLDDDFFQTIFGDHCRVSVTTKGVDVQEYEHD